MIWEQDEVTGNCPNTDRTSGILARGQAWMRREEPGPGTVDRWHGKANRSSGPFSLLLTTWTPLCCCSHSNNEEKGSKNAGTRDKLMLVTERSHLSLKELREVLFTICPLPYFFLTSS